MKKKLVIVLVMSLAISGLAMGASVTDTLSVSATKSVACNIISVTPVVFADLSSGSSITGNGEITVNCASGTQYYVTLDAGQNYNSQTSDRRMTFESSTTSYWLFKDAGLTQQWGDVGSASTYPDGTALSATGNGSDETHTVFGETLGAVWLPVGTYTDSVLVTVTF